MAYRSAKSVTAGPQVGNSRLGSAIASNTVIDLGWDPVRRASSENEVRMIQLVKEFSAGHEDAPILDAIFGLLYDETDANIMDSDAGRSALHWAVLHGQVQLAKALVEAGALVNTFAKDGSTPLMAAVRKGSVELATLLMAEGAYPDLINRSTGMGPLLLAATFGNLDMVELLLERRANPNITWQGPQGPVVPLAAVASKVIEPHPSADQYMAVVHALLQAGANANITIDMARRLTLLHDAVRRRQPALAQALLNARADPNMPTADGITPLMTAVRLSSCELAEMLIDAGALVDEKNENNGKSAFCMACNLADKAMIQLLLARGANVNTRWFNPNELNPPPLPTAPPPSQPLPPRASHARAQHHPQEFNSPILVMASKCDDSLVALPGSTAATPSGRYGGGPASPAMPGARSPTLMSSPTGSRPASGSITPMGSCRLGMRGSGYIGGGTQMYVDLVRLLIDAGADINMQGSKNGITPALIAVDNAHLGLMQLLLDCKVDVNLPDPTGRTPLIAACMEGMLDMAGLLLQHGANPNATMRDGWTSLMGAVLQRQEALVRLLLQAGADVRAIVPQGFLLSLDSTPLMAAAGEGCFDIMQQLLDAGADPNQTNRTGQNAMWCACRGGQVQAVRLLLAAGADLRKMQGSPSPLVQAACSGVNTCVELVLGAGAHVDERDEGPLVHSGRFTPLAAACLHGRLATAELLLQHGADVNVRWALEQDQVEMTPLLAALSRTCGSTDAECAALVELLLHHKADFSATESKHGHTAIQVAASEGRYGALRVLLSHGADASGSDKDGASPLVLAARCGCVDGTKALLEAGADVHAATLKGVSPLAAAMVAYASGDASAELLQVLLAAGADPNAPHPKDGTLLSAAIQCVNPPEAVSLLLAAGADPNCCNKQGVVPLQQAMSRGAHEVVKLLLQAGANPQAPGLDWPAMQYGRKGHTEILLLLAQAGLQLPTEEGEERATSHHGSGAHSLRVPALGPRSTSPGSSSNPSQRTSASGVLHSAARRLSGSGGGAAYDSSGSHKRGPHHGLTINLLAPPMELECAPGSTHSLQPVPAHQDLDDDPSSSPQTLARSAWVISKRSGSGRQHTAEAVAFATASPLMSPALEGDEDEGGLDSRPSLVRSERTKSSIIRNFAGHLPEVAAE